MSKSRTKAAPMPEAVVRKTANQAYPEHEKLHAVRAKSEAIGEFLDWFMHERRGVLAEYVDGHDYPVPANFRGGIEGVLAEYFEIDLDVLDAEKRAMLAGIREEL